jgi:hypothetical protein
MNLEQQEYIKKNRIKESMLTMAKCLGISYNKVRNYMILKNLQVSQETVFIIRSGHFAIVPLDDFQALKRALTSCKMSLQAHPDNTTDSEFEGFVSLADEILNNKLNLIV